MRLFSKAFGKPAVDAAAAPERVGDQLTPDDIAELNGAALEYVRRLPAAEIERRVEEITVGDISDPAELARAADVLEREGIIVIPNFLSEDLREIAEKAVARVKAAYAQATPGTNSEADDMFIQAGDPALKTYGARATHPKTVVAVRGGADAGMIDVFNFDWLVGAKGDQLRNPFTEENLLSLIREDESELEAANLNLYLNRGVEVTRGFHADSYTKSLKGFVYLSDVNSVDDGPYCFVRRSHQGGPWRRANQKISELAAAPTETPFVDIAMAVPMVAPAGSFILSDQAGFHRGIPQAPGAERRVLVMRYK